MRFEPNYKDCNWVISSFSKDSFIISLTMNSKDIHTEDIDAEHFSRDSVDNQDNHVWIIRVNLLKRVEFSQPCKRDNSIWINHDDIETLYEYAQNKLIISLDEGGMLLVDNWKSIRIVDSSDD